MLDQQQQQLVLSQSELREKEEQLALQSAQLAEQQAQLSAQQAQLAEQEAQLNAQSAQLAEQQATLGAQSAQLTQQQSELTEQQTQLSAQEQELLSLQAQLAAQQTELENAQAGLNAALASQQQQQALLEAQQQKLDKLVGVRTEIIEDLMSALRQSNITGANVDDSGAIVFSSEMMFSIGSSGLNETGKQFLNRFLPNYLRVLMSEDYAKNVSQIIIEGHTDTTGSYMTNVELSQERALSVLKYVMSNEFTGISKAEKQRLEEVVTINGRAYSDPIYHADGSVDMSASRRVVIKFRLNDEDMVTEMLNVLKDME
jgi:chemotaxis protein MotB